MYLPAPFRSDDPAIAAELMRAHPFASLISTDDDGLPFVTHLPLHLQARADGAGVAGACRQGQSACALPAGAADGVGDVFGAARLPVAVGLSGPTARADVELSGRALHGAGDAAGRTAGQGRAAQAPDR